MKNITFKILFSKKALICGIALFAGINSFAQSDDLQIAFPGAEGWGRYASGGRAVDPAIGSNVYFVTSLDDYKSSETLIDGSLRLALTDGDDTPRTTFFMFPDDVLLKERLIL